MRQINVKTKSRTELLEITSEVQNSVEEEGIDEGFALVYVPHTTAGVIINENADPSVVFDIISHLTKLVPPDGNYKHIEGNSDAHIKSVLVGQWAMIPINGGRLALGTWQGIFFAEFDGPRTRKVYIQVIGK